MSKVGRAGVRDPRYLLGMGLATLVTPHAHPSLSCRIQDPRPLVLT